jgi:hypothetical protein
MIKKETEQSRMPYLSILMASINSNSNSGDHPEILEEKEISSPERKELAEA